MRALQEAWKGASEPYNELKTKSILTEYEYIAKCHLKKVVISTSSFGENKLAYGVTATWIGPFTPNRATSSKRRVAIPILHIGLFTVYNLHYETNQMS